MHRLRSLSMMAGLALALGACGGATEEAAETSTTAAPISSAPTTSAQTSEGDTVIDSNESSQPTEPTEVPSTVTPAPPPEDDTVVEPAPSDPPPADEEPDEPAPDVVDASVPAGFESLVAAARSDLASVLGVAESDIGVALVESIVWPDASLGCPEPGMAYAQVQVDGWRTVLTHGGNSYTYHGGGDRPGPFLCRKPTFPTS